MKNLTSEFLLEFHMKIYHENVGCFPYDLCDKRFQNFRQMISHVKTSHSKLPSLPVEEINANLKGEHPNSEEPGPTHSMDITSPTTMVDSSLTSTPDTMDINSNMEGKVFDVDECQSE